MAVYTVQFIPSFLDRIPGVDGAPDFYRITANKPGVLLMDAATGTEWNFQSCATSGKEKGACRFNWRNDNPNTTICGNGRS
jgi:hypothetical protein